MKEKKEEELLSRTEVCNLVREVVKNIVYPGKALDIELPKDIHRLFGLCVRDYIKERVSNPAIVEDFPEGEDYGFTVGLSSVTFKLRS